MQNSRFPAPPLSLFILSSFPLPSSPAASGALPLLQRHARALCAVSDRPPNSSRGFPTALMTHLIRKRRFLPCSAAVQLSRRRRPLLKKRKKKAQRPEENGDGCSLVSTRLSSVAKQVQSASNFASFKRVRDVEKKKVRTESIYNNEIAKTAEVEERNDRQ